MNIFSISTWGEPTESSSQWLPSLRQEKPSNAGATTKRWRKNTSISQKYSWVSDYKITTQTTMSWFSTIWKKRATIYKKSVYCLLMSWKGILRLRAHNKNKPKLSKSELPNPMSSNHRILTQLFHRVLRILMKWQKKKTSNWTIIRFLVNISRFNTKSTTFSTIHTRRTSTWVLSFEASTCNSFGRKEVRRRREKT